jgi:hypothetical protein
MDNISEFFTIEGIIMTLPEAWKTQEKNNLSFSTWSANSGKTKMCNTKTTACS